MLLTVHIVAGCLAIILGGIALSTRKGGLLHRRSGLLFVYSTVVMASTAAVLGIREGAAAGNVVGGLLTVYFVGTALTAVRPATQWTRYIDAVALVMVVGLTIFTITSGFDAFNRPGTNPAGVPWRAIGVMSFIIGAAMILAAVGDLRVMRHGLLRGGPRLARHLWRMCFALLIAAGSFFSIRERVEELLPALFATAPMRALPILLVLGAMLYWLWKVRGGHSPPTLQRLHR